MTTPPLLPTAEEMRAIGTHTVNVRLDYPWNLQFMLDHWPALIAMREELERLRKSDASNEAQLVAISQFFGGKDARNVTQGDRSIAGLVAQECGKLEAELAAAKQWKEEALAVEREWDEQAIAKLLGAKFGESCRKTISERVPQLVKDLAAAKADAMELHELHSALTAYGVPGTEDDHPSNRIGPWIEAAKQEIKRLSRLLPAHVIRTET